MMFAHGRLTAMCRCLVQLLPPPLQLPPQTQLPLPLQQQSRHSLHSSPLLRVAVLTTCRSKSLCD